MLILVCCQLFSRLAFYQCPQPLATPNMSNLIHSTQPLGHSAEVLNSRGSTKRCSRCHNIRPLTTFINDRNIVLKTCYRCRRPLPQQVECETSARAAAGDTDDLLVRCRGCKRHHPHSLFISAAGRRFKTCFSCRVCYLSDPPLEIY
jgi:hypothetical protein